MPFDQVLSTTGLTFGLATFVFFVPAMILINAVVEPEFLSKLQVRISSSSPCTSFIRMFFFILLMNVQGGHNIGSQFRVRLE